MQVTYAVATVKSYSNEQEKKPGQNISKARSQTQDCKTTWFYSLDVSRKGNTMEKGSAVMVARAWG